MEAAGYLWKAATHLAGGTEPEETHRRGPWVLEGKGTKERELRGPEASFNEGCVHTGTRIGASPTHTCLSWSLRVTLWVGVAKWGGAKLPGSSVNLTGNRGGLEVRSVPSHPPLGGPRWPALQPDLWPQPTAHTQPAPVPGKELSSRGHWESVSLNPPGQGAERP